MQPITLSIYPSQYCPATEAETCPPQAVNTLIPLTESESSQMNIYPLSDPELAFEAKKQQMLSPSAGDKCSLQVLHVLQRTPQHIMQKLKVIVVTHLRNIPMMKKYDYCVVIFTEVNNELVILDPTSGKTRFTQPMPWLRSLYLNSDIFDTHALGHSKRLCFQFRILDAFTYTTLHKTLCECPHFSSLPEILSEHPNFHQHSTQLNVCEIFKLFNGQISYHSVMSHPNIINGSRESIPPDDKKYFIANYHTVTSSEVNTLKAIIKEKQPQMETYSCHQNIRKILEDTPVHLCERLNIILETHEGNGFIRYFGKPFSFHVFMLVKTPDGLVILDPELKDEPSMPSRLWISTAYDKDCFSYTLQNNYTCQYLPQFRIISSHTFLEHFNDLSKTATYPECRDLKDMTKSKLWDDSSRLNFYEFYQLAHEKMTLEQVVLRCDGIQTPLTRLSLNEIDFLKKTFL